MKMLLQRYNIFISIAIILAGTSLLCYGEDLRQPYRILVDTDVDTDDLFALLYILKLNRSQFDLQAVTINTNEWTNAGHAVNQIYDILYMMDRDDIAVGVGGEGGILNDGTIQADVGGYLPIIDQGRGTAGPCRYRQAIPVGSGGRLNIDTNFGYRKSFLPQGSRRYTPLRQPTAQQVMINTISSGLTTVLIIGSHTNMAIFLMNNPHLKKNVEHIYVMGGGVRSENPSGCCPENSSSTCQPKQCGDRGNLFTGYRSNPYAEFNIFGDPFAAYQVIHSGIPVTLVPLDATNTIPITENFFKELEQNQDTYEAQYAFKSLQTNTFMWDSFTAGVATSIMKNLYKPNGENEFAEMEYINITVVTSNEPYGISDGSNPLFDGLKVPKFNLTRNGVHSGHVQTGIHDPYCIRENGVGICQDGYTKEVAGPDSVRVLVATSAKPNRNNGSLLDKEFFNSFIEVLNRPKNSGRFNFTNQFPYYKEVYYKPDFGGKKTGKNIVFDMDMSAGDFLALLYLLKSPVEMINMKAIFVTPTGWASPATIDVVYDVLHMMGRDDIPVGLGDVFGLNQSNAGCKYTKAMPHGAGGFLDSDTLYGLARNLPRSPRRYTPENSVKFGPPRTEFRQPLASEVWQSVVKSLDQGSKVTILTNGPLTTLANISLLDNNSSSFIQDVFIVGGHINYNNNTDKGNVINVPSNQYAEINMFLDPLAAKTVFDSDLNITLIPLDIQRKVNSFPTILEKLFLGTRTPEAIFARRLLARLYYLKHKHRRYQHLDTFLGEILGSVIVAGDNSILKSTFQVKPVKVFATGALSTDGKITIDNNHGKSVNILEDLDSLEYYQLYASRLGDEKQSAVVGSFYDQARIWSTLPTENESS